MGEIIRRRELVANVIDLSKKGSMAAMSAVTYTGSAFTPTPTITCNGQTLVAGTDFTYSYLNNTNAGTATVKATGTGKKYKGTVSGTFTINKMSLTIPSCSGSYTYTGSAQSVTINNFNSTWETQSGTTSATNAGTYTVTWSLKDTSNTQWTDSTTATKSATWTIAKAAGSVSLSTSSISLEEGGTGTFTFSYVGDGNLSVTSSNSAICAVSYSGTTVTCSYVSGGVATITVAISEGINYTAAGGTASVSCIVIVALPTLSQTSYDYTGSTISPNFVYDNTGCTIGGTYESASAGDYTATFTLNDGYKWTDGTTEVKSIGWQVWRYWYQYNCTFSWNYYTVVTKYKISSSSYRTYLDYAIGDSIAYSHSYPSIDSNTGVISLDSTTTITINLKTYTSPVKGYYLVNNSLVYLIASAATMGSTIRYVTGLRLWPSTYSAQGDYVGSTSSSSRGAYPDSGVSGSYWYSYSGYTRLSTYATVNSTNGSAYPTNGLSGSYYYVAVV